MITDHISFFKVVCIAIWLWICFIVHECTTTSTQVTSTGCDYIYVRLYS